jgi:hypothetical protein
MGQTTDQIESHIEDKREDLKSNLQELHGRVKTATDWRHYFDRSPGMMLAAAFGGGVLLSAMMKRGRAGAHASTGSSSTSFDSEHPVRAKTKHEVLDKVDAIRSALVAVAATKLKGMLGEAVPGFSEHLAEAERQRRAQPEQREGESTH